VTWHRERTLDLGARLLDTQDAVNRLIAQLASVHLGAIHLKKGNGYPPTYAKAMADIGNVRHLANEQI
jgi:hypothetical protein